MKLKKMKLFILVLFFLFSKIALCQTNWSVDLFSIPNIRPNVDNIVRYNHGLMINYSIDKKKTIKSGIFYARKNLQFKSFCLGGPCTDSLKWDIFTFEFPLLFGYEFYDFKKLHFYFQLGIINIYSYRLVRIEKRNNFIYKRSERNGLSGFDFCINFTIGFSYKLTNRISLKVEPVFRTSVSKFSYNMYSNFFGLGLGLGYLFKE